MTVETGTPMDVQEHQIAFHQAQSLRLKRLFNQHSLFNSKLPPEVLMLVFLEVTGSFHNRLLESWYVDRDEYMGEASHKPLYRWIRVVQVCKHWRKVALDCAELWTILVLDERIHPRLYKTILERSCGLPLTLILHASHNSLCCSGRCQTDAVHSSNYAKAMDVFQSVSVNTRSLSVFIDREDHAAVWEVLRGLRRAERLQLLRIESVGYITFDHPGNVSPPGDLIAPSSLRSVKVTGVAFGWSNTLLGPGLRHLNLSNHYFTVLPSVDEMLSALQRMQQLETLGYTRQVTLPCLCWLRIPLKSSASSTLLPFLQLPPTTSVIVFRQSRELSSHSEEKIPKQTIAALAKAAAGILKDLAISLQHPFGSNLTRPFRTQSVTAVLAAIDLRHVHMLSIWEDSCPRARTLLESLRAAENLTTLKLGQKICFPIGAVLAGWRRPASMDADKDPADDEYDFDIAPDWYGYGDPGDGDRILDGQDDDVAASAVAPGSAPQEAPAVSAASPLFPRLRILHLSEFDFPMATSGKRPHSLFRFYKYWYDCWKDIEYGLDVRGLVKALRTRVTRGAEELVRIEFADCQCKEREHLVPLIEVVPEVWLERQRVTMETLGNLDA
ncbi:hypothetical protein V8D89_011461 [Ganoderma adspersum]